jgi:hypothetical protein
MWAAVAWLPTRGLQVERGRVLLWFARAALYMRPHAYVVQTCGKYKKRSRLISVGFDGGDVVVRSEVDQASIGRSIVFVCVPTRGRLARAWPGGLLFCYCRGADNDDDNA